MFIIILRYWREGVAVKGKGSRENRSLQSLTTMNSYTGIYGVFFTFHMRKNHMTKAQTNV